MDASSVEGGTVGSMGWHSTDTRFANRATISASEPQKTAGPGGRVGRESGQGLTAAAISVSVRADGRLAVFRGSVSKSVCRSVFKFMPEFMSEFMSVGLHLLFLCPSRQCDVG